MWAEDFFSSNTITLCVLHSTLLQFFSYGRQPLDQDGGSAVLYTKFVEDTSEIGVFFLLLLHLVEQSFLYKKMFVCHEWSYGMVVYRVTVASFFCILLASVCVWFTQRVVCVCVGWMQQSRFDMRQLLEISNEYF